MPSSVSSPAPSKRSVAPAPLVTSDDVRRELYRLFGARSGQDELVVRLYGNGAADDAGAVDTLDELLRSLEMHGGSGALERTRVAAPDASTIERALLVLSRRELQRTLLDEVLTSFGRRLIDPLSVLLDRGPEGAIMARLVVVRERVREDVKSLALTHETQAILLGDLERMMTDEYLAMLADNEERVQRPRVKQLAQEILRMIGDTFHAALTRWPAHASTIARAATRRRPESEIALRELPVLIREQVVSGVEEFLWVETSNDIQGSLAAMLAAQRGILAAPPELEREAYRELAERCWRLVTSLS